MRWLRRSSEPPQLLGLSPLRTEDSLSTADQNQHEIHSESVSNVFRNRTPNQSTRKSRIGEKNHMTLCRFRYSWLKATTILCQSHGSLSRLDLLQKSKSFYQESNQESINQLIKTSKLFNILLNSKTHKITRSTTLIFHS
jgi:hypothetical protein